MSAHDDRFWLHDAAHRAVQQWMRGWRSVNPTAALPSLHFADHLGEHARAPLRPGEEVPDMLRRFSSAGYEGRCVCGRDPMTGFANGVAVPADSGVALSAAIDLPRWILEAYKVT